MGSDKEGNVKEDMVRGKGGSMEKELVAVIDFGGQDNQLAARRVRECNV